MSVLVVLIMTGSLLPAEEHSPSIFEAWEPCAEWQVCVYVRVCLVCCLATQISKTDIS